jgi:hypothetical protein|tara:strand:- start:1774 stop:2055 length:282 start_codon:yes stop_codon:yes gene_type:complete
MPYQITARTQMIAKKLNVTVKPSTVKNKKIDVFKNNKKIASVGDIRYNDFHIYLQTKGKEYAEARKKAYRTRHAKNISKVGSNGYYANALLWS